MLDQGNTSVREGMRITFKLLAEANEISRQNDVGFLVVVIPTKEMVFADYLEHNREIHLGDAIDKLLANERLARERTFRFLKDSGIPYVDTLPALKRSVGQELYARTATDMHPNGNGYRVIAEAIFEALGETPVSTNRLPTSSESFAMACLGFRARMRPTAEYRVLAGRSALPTRQGVLFSPRFGK